MENFRFDYLVPDRFCQCRGVESRKKLFFFIFFFLPFDEISFRESGIFFAAGQFFFE